MRHLSEWEKVWVDGMTHIHARANDDRSSWYWGRGGERQSVGQGRHISGRVEGGNGAVGHTFTHTGDVDGRRLPAGAVGRGSRWEDGVDGQRVRLEEE